MTAPDREAIYANALFLGWSRFPWPIEGNPVARADDSVFSGFMTACSGASLIPVVTLAYCPLNMWLLMLHGRGSRPCCSNNAKLRLEQTSWTTIPTSTILLYGKTTTGCVVGLIQGPVVLGLPLAARGDNRIILAMILYPKAHTVFTEAKPESTFLYGPNCHLAARSEGYDASYGAVRLIPVTSISYRRFLMI